VQHATEYYLSYIAIENFSEPSLADMSSSSARISISSDEVNLLIYRYLVEAGLLSKIHRISISLLTSGFKHSAFVFHGESLLNRTPNLVQTDMPPGTLVTLLQKALLFLYVETHVANDGQTIQCDETFSLLKPHDHDHGPLDAQIQFDESIADQINGNGKRADTLPGAGDEKNAKKSKLSSSASPSLQPSTVPAEDTAMSDSTSAPQESKDQDAAKSEDHGGVDSVTRIINDEPSSTADAPNSREYNP
jgi:hypothetical protein